MHCPVECGDSAHAGAYATPKSSSTSPHASPPRHGLCALPTASPRTRTLIAPMAKSQEETPVYERARGDRVLSARGTQALHSAAAQNARVLSPAPLLPPGAPPVPSLRACGSCARGRCGAACSVHPPRYSPAPIPSSGVTRVQQHAPRVSLPRRSRSDLLSRHGRALLSPLEHEKKLKGEPSWEFALKHARLRGGVASSVCEALGGGRWCQPAAVQRIRRQQPGAGPATPARCQVGRHPPRAPVHASRAQFHVLASLLFMSARA